MSKPLSVVPRPTGASVADWVDGDLVIATGARRMIVATRDAATEVKRMVGAASPGCLASSVAVYFGAELGNLLCREALS